MSPRPELDRLAGARPLLLDHTDLVVDAGEEDRILRQILSTTRPAAPPARTRRSPGTGADRQGAARRYLPRLATGGLAALVTIAGAIAAASLLTAGTGRGGAAGAGRATAGRAASSLGAARGHAPDISFATVADRTTAAVTGAVRQDVLYSQTQYAPGSGIPRSTTVIREWSHGVWARQQSFSLGGVLTEDASAVFRDGQRVRRFVDYTTRTWQHDTIPAAQYGPGPSARQTVRMLLGPMPDSRETRAITQVSVQGRPEYQVTFTWSARRHDLEGWPLEFTPAQFFPAGRDGPAVTGVTIWLDADTYLPLRLAVSGPGRRILAVETLSWLPPSQASRAELRPAPIPAGFRNVAEAAQ